MPRQTLEAVKLWLGTQVDGDQWNKEGEKKNFEDEEEGEEKREDEENEEDEDEVVVLE